MRFSDAQLEVIRFAAIECEMQMSGEASVYDMVRAWQYAYDEVAKGDVIVQKTGTGATVMRRYTRLPTAADVVRLGELIEPVKNRRGYRQVPVRVGSDVKGDWRLVPTQIDNLIDAVTTLSPAEWFQEYEDVHPFRDGNGRTGQILFNWLNATLETPKWAPNFWADERRIAGRGA